MPHRNNYVPAVIMLVLCCVVAPGLSFAREKASIGRCLVEVRLTTVASVRSDDGSRRGDTTPAEYFVRAGNGRELGPFELRTGEQSNFSPGLRLAVVDSGWSRPNDDDSSVASVTLEISVREDDSSPAGEDDIDDSSVPLRIREHLVCPNGQAMVTRFIDVIQRSSDPRPRKPDTLRLGLQLRTMD